MTTPTPKPKRRYEAKDAVEEMALVLYDYFNDERKTRVGKHICIKMAEVALKVLGERFTRAIDETRN